MVYEAEWTPADLAALRSELELFREYYKTWMQQGVPVWSMFVRDANSAVTLKERRWCSRCGLGEGAVGVDYDGTLYPCHRFIDSHEIKIGDIYNGFNANRLNWMEHWRKAEPYCETPKKCLECNYKKACTGGWRRDELRRFRRNSRQLGDVLHNQTTDNRSSRRHL